MERFLERYADYTYALLRVVSGLLFFLYGTTKFFGYPPLPPGVPATDLDALSTVAGSIELVAGFLILIGLFSGTAAFVASGEMAVAYFLVHQPMGFWPTTTRGGLAVLFCFIFLYIASRGSGVWSIDSLRSKISRHGDS
jgi:putative oxidoreductase